MKQTRFLAFFLLLVGVGIAAYLTAPGAMNPAMESLPVETSVASVVVAQIVPPAAVQSIPEAEILGYVYLDVNGGVTSSSGLNVPAEWDGTKPPQPMYVGDKSEGAQVLACELDVALTDDVQTVYRCGRPSKG